MTKKGDQKPEAVKPVGKPKTAKAVEAKAKPAVAKPKVVEKPKPAVKPKSAAKPGVNTAKAKPAATANKSTPARTDSDVAKPKAAVQASVAPVPASSSAVTPRPLPSNQAPEPQMLRSPQPALPTPGPLAKRLKLYSQLMRLDKPIGIFLLLWPTLWSLWLAAGGLPRWDLLVIFTLGVVLMRSAGCVINDFADRKIDGQVARTKARPLATGSVSSNEALALFVVLCLLAFGLVLLTNTLTIKLSIGGLLLAFCYPFMKRHTHLPQVVLGAAFAWSIPMAFAAQSGALGQEMWLIYLAVVLWTVVYDTFYAMVDRDDDKRIGVKSTAILFGEQDRFITGFLQLLTLYALVLVGGRFELGSIYYVSLTVAAGLFVYQQYLIRFREREPCFRAFLNNHWVGMVVFIGIVADLALKTPH